MQDRVILHCDLNNFFASVEMISKPELRGKPFAVCGDPSRRAGIVLAKSEPAKAAGVKTGMAIWQARQLCPDIIIVSSNHGDYSRYSKRAQEIYYRYTDKVEPFGGDECWLDITASLRLLGKTVPQITDEIRTTIKKELDLTVSIGVSWNKTYAKLGSDMKKPDAVTFITRENYKKVVFPAPVNNLLYVGRKTVRVLERLGILTLGDLAAADGDLLTNQIGVNAHKIIEMARGEDQSDVRTFDYRREVKSVGNGTTMPHDMTRREEIEQVIYLLSEEVAYRMRKKGLKGTTVNLSLRSADLEWTGAQTTVMQATNACKTITEIANRILSKLWKPGMPLMGLRVAVSGLTKDTAMQLDMLGNSAREGRNDKLSEVFDNIRRKYGAQSVAFANAIGGEYKLDFEVVDEN